jgi:hypothetical protein
MARLDPDFRQKSPERKVSPEENGTGSEEVHGPATILPPVSLLANFDPSIRDTAVSSSKDLPPSSAHSAVLGGPAKPTVSNAG